MHDPVKAFKLAFSNMKLPKNSKDYSLIADIFMTESSLKRFFEKVFGAKCDVVAKLIYMKASNNLDSCKLTIIDFWRVFE